MINTNINVGVFSPELKIGNPKYNVEVIKDIIYNECDDLNIILFPELSITGYSCDDLFFQSKLISDSMEALIELVLFSKRIKEGSKFSLIVVGAPIVKDNLIYNCAVYIYNGKILAIVPKTYVGSDNRWFASSRQSTSDKFNYVKGSYALENITFGRNILIRDANLDFVIGTDIGEDLFAPIPPSSEHSLNGANLILNLSASHNIVGKCQRVKDLACMQSARNICGYVYASAGIDESTTNAVFSGQKLICYNGKVLAEGKYDNNSIKASIDLEKLNNDRMKTNYFSSEKNNDYKYVDINMRLFPYEFKYLNNVNPYPFVSSDKQKRLERCEEIFTLQSIALSQRMKKTGIEKLVLGVSGGLDSTLALLVAVDAMNRRNLPLSNIIGITMPGFGTTNRTKNNSVKLMELFEITSEDISIVPAVAQHFKDIGHPGGLYDSTYENSQARERTQILMDKANQQNALVVGTGDLSELALGWCTYNGDHMSMYSVNGDIPKTLVKYIILSIAEKIDIAKENCEKYRNIDYGVSDILRDICDTPISPELLPTDENGNMVQKTEESIGKYDLHDFFLYHMLRNGFSPNKIYELALIAFPKIEKELILNTMKTFYKRFFSQQFKRSCLPDGPKVGTVSISPRGDLKMASDACSEIWLDEINNIII